MQVKTPVQEIMALRDFINNLSVHQSPVEASGINDSTEDLTTTWSSTKIKESITTAISELVNGSDSALDTLKELADALGNDVNFAATLAEQMGKRVRVDESQMFSTSEQLTACTNLGIGNPDTDLLAVYTSAKA